MQTVHCHIKSRLLTLLLSELT